MKLILFCMIMITIPLANCGNDDQVRKEKGSSKLGRFFNRLLHKSEVSVVGGEETLQREYPWLAVVVLPGSSRIGASIITAFHILTATYFVYELKPEELSVLVGVQYKETWLSGYKFTGQVYSVAMNIPQKTYVRINYLNDISVLVTQDKIRLNPLVSPICLPRNRIDLIGKELKALGFKKDINGKYIIKEIDMAFVAFDNCINFWEAKLNKETVICASRVKSNTDYGYSGDGLVYRNPGTKTYTLVGVIPYSDVYRPSYPLVSTNVYPFLTWIGDIISETKPEVTICKGD